MRSRQGLTVQRNGIDDAAGLASTSWGVMPTNSGVCTERTFLEVKGSQVQILSARPCDRSRDRRQTGLRLGPALSFFKSWSGGSFGCSGGLVVAVGVEDQLAEELAGDSIDNADLQVVGEQDDVGSYRAGFLPRPGPFGATAGSGSFPEMFRRECRPRADILSRSVPRRVYRGPRCRRTCRGLRRTPLPIRCGRRSRAR